MSSKSKILQVHKYFKKFIFHHMKVTDPLFYINIQNIVIKEVSGIPDCMKLAYGLNPL